MNKECCTIKVNETDKGYVIEVTGDDVKGCCKSIVVNDKDCCPDSKSDDSLQKSE